MVTKGSARSTASRIRRALADALINVQILGQAAKLWWSARTSPYTCFVGVDPEGLRRAALLRTFVRAKLVYYSLELMLSDEVTTREQRALKAVERRLSRSASFVIVQDQERASLLSDDNEIPMAKFVYVPNAPLGPARRKPDRWWHDRFALPPETRILLHSGSVGAWTGIGDIVDASTDLPPGWVLVVHTRYDPSTAKHDLVGSSQLEQIMERAKPGKVFFSLKPVPRQLLPRLIDAADVGIAFYVPAAGNTYTQKNIQTIGLSSGKVAAYLAAGLPVVVNRATTLGALVDKERVGVGLDTAEGLPAAIRSIAAVYEATSNRAVAFFNRELDFRLGFLDVSQRLSAVSAEPGREADPFRE